MADKSDLYNRTKETNCLVTAVTNADADCASVDMRGFRSVLFLIAIGDSADTLSAVNKIELELEDSDDDSSFADVTDQNFVKGNVEDLTAGLFEVIDDPAEDQTIVQVQYNGPKRYVRVVLNFSGTHTTGTPIAVIGLSAGSIHKPV